MIDWKPTETTTSTKSSCGGYKITGVKVAKDRWCYVAWKRGRYWTVLDAYDSAAEAEERCNEVAAKQAELELLGKLHGLTGNSCKGDCDGRSNLIKEDTRAVRLFGFNGLI